MVRCDILRTGEDWTCATENTADTEMGNARAYAVRSVSAVARFQPFGVYDLGWLHLEIEISPNGRMVGGGVDRLCHFAIVREQRPVRAAPDPLSPDSTSRNVRE